jgi:hypothetical protein
MTVIRKILTNKLLCYSNRLVLLTSLPILILQPHKDVYNPIDFCINLKKKVLKNTFFFQINISFLDVYNYMIYTNSDN